MREIKFRAWDNNIKKMLYSFNYENICGKAWAGNGKIQHEVDGKNLIIMQYTGLKDKNDKEIYEGDIVKCDEKIGEVMWCEDNVAWICLWQPQTKNKKGGADNLGSTFPSPLKEIIGNIYESSR